MPATTPAAAPTPPSTPALEARDIRHGFESAAGLVEVLHGVSLRVMPGEVVAITGPSGSGKSTLLHLIGGLDTPQHGEIWWAGERADTLDTQARAVRRAGQLGLIFQHHYLLEDLNVLQNVMVSAMLSGQGLSGKLTPTEHTERATKLLERVGLANRGQAMPGVLSGGERQRVAVARALAPRPAVILADEPTGSLDRANAETIAGLLVSLAREEGAGVLLVTHDDRLATYADRTLHLLDGRLAD